MGGWTRPQLSRPSHRHSVSPNRSSARSQRCGEQARANRGSGGGRHGYGDFASRPFPDDSHQTRCSVRMPCTASGRGPQYSATPVEPVLKQSGVVFAKPGREETGFHQGRGPCENSGLEADPSPEPRADDGGEMRSMIGSNLCAIKEGCRPGLRRSRRARNFGFASSN